MNIDNNKLLLNIDPQSLRDIQVLAKNLNTNINGVLAQAVALLMLAQGGQVFIKKGDQEIEIKNYKDKTSTRFWTS
jgi:hypothetical protein